MSKSESNIINSKIIHKQKTVLCTIDEIWAKWTTHEGLKTFFGADNNIELKLGGKYEIYFLMDNPIRLRGGESNVILSYLPNEMLSFTWNAPPQYEYVRNHKHKTWVVVKFKSVDENKTLVELNHIGWIDGSEWNEVFAYFDKAWDIVLNNLEASCIKNK